MTTAKKKSALASRFSLAPDAMTHRTIASVEGEVGTGKTYFALTAPGPILVQDIDKGTEGVIEQFRKKGKEIYLEKYVWEPGDVDAEDGTLQEEAKLKEAAIEIRNRWERDFFYAIENGIRTVSMDNESRIWQVYRYAEFGGPNSGDMKDYDKLNLRFEGLINRAKACEINLFMTRAMKDRWGMYGKPKADGRRTFAKQGREVWGYEHLSGAMFTELTFLHRTQEETDEAGDGLGEYVIKVGKCRHNAGLQFSIQPRCSFPELGTLMVEGSEESDWS